jgi:hypothetical protein
MTTVQTLNDSDKQEKKNEMTANPSQNKKSCKATQKPTQFAAHFILPNAPKPTHRPDRQILAATSIDLGF